MFLLYLLCPLILNGCQSNSSDDYTIHKAKIHMQHLYGHIALHEGLNNEYPNNVEEIKAALMESKAIRDWDEQVLKQWHYYKPDPSDFKSKQIILKHKKYKLLLQVEIEHGVIVNSETVYK